MADPIDFSIISLASVVSPTLLRSIRSVSFVMEYKKGELIERHGTTAKYISLIRSGSVRLGIDGIDGSRFNMSILGEGSTFGEISLLLEQDVRHDAHAETDVVLDRLDLPTVKKLMKSDPDFGHAMLRVAYARFSTMLDYIGDAKRQSLEARTAKLIHGMANTSAQDDLIECRQVDLAHALSVSRVSIGKALKALDQKNLIKLGYGHITIPSKEALARYISEQGEQ